MYMSIYADNQDLDSCGMSLVEQPLKISRTPVSEAFVSKGVTTLVSFWAPVLCVHSPTILTTLLLQKLGKVFGIFSGIQP